jgi:integrase
MSLSDFACKNAKPKDKPYRLADGDGLYLLVRNNGSKLWQLRYRYLEKENILSFGKYPLVSLLDARGKRDDAKRLLIDGINPSTKRKEEKTAAITEARTTFGLIAEEYIMRMEERDAAAATVTKTKWLLEDLASPLAKRPIKEITAAEIFQLLQKIEKSGRRETARRLRGVIGSVFRLAIVTLWAEADPTLHLRGALQPPKVSGRAAIVDEKKFGQLLSTIDGYDGWPTIKAALQFLALTCVRPGEIRGATRDEFDRKKAVWHIPAERMKMRAPHDVPLSKQALSVLDIRRATRRHFSAEDKIRIVLEGLRGEDSIAELCRKEGIAQSLYYTWSKEFLEAGKRRLAGDTARAATTGEVQDLRRETRALKEAVADLTLENRLLKKSMIADGGDDE